MKESRAELERRVKAMNVEELIAFSMEAKKKAGTITCMSLFWGFFQFFMFCTAWHYGDKVDKFFAYLFVTLSATLFVCATRSLLLFLGIRNDIKEMR